MINDPILTSDSDYVDIHMRYAHGWDYALHINSVIANNGWRPVGVRIRGRVPGSPDWAVPGNMKRGCIWIGGSSSNTFTGRFEISESNHVFLNKSNGATAIRGDVLIHNGGGIWLMQGNQISDTATVTLDGRKKKAVLAFQPGSYKSESFHRLVVKGEGILGFYNTNDNLYIDDLIIETGSILTITDYNSRLPRLLVRKDSEHLNDALWRIKFSNRQDRYSGVRNYNKDYWEIIPSWTVPKLPEPSTYGAIVSGVALGFALVRSKRRRRVPPRLKGEA